MTDFESFQDLEDTLKAEGQMLLGIFTTSAMYDLPKVRSPKRCEHLSFLVEFSYMWARSYLI